MAFERISLNIIPDGEMPVFHASQFDAGRPIIIDLYNGDDAYTPAAGVTFELHCRKVDDNIVTLDSYEVDGNTVTFASTEQLCACSGDNLCEIAIMLNELLMGTLNFILRVERDPIAGGLTSETSIYNLQQQIDDIISGEGYVKDTDLEVLQSDWDETDVTSPAYIKNKPGPSTYEQADWTENDPSAQSYIKHKPDLKAVATSGSYNDLTDKPTIPAAQVNSDWNASSGVAEILNKPTIPTKTSELTNDSGFVESTDLAAVATSGDYDDLLNKPSIPAAQVQSDWNQTNTGAVDYIKNKPDLTLVKSATGNPCTFTTNLTDNLISVKADIAYNASGYTGANITLCGVNQFDKTNYVDNKVYGDGIELNALGFAHSDFIDCFPNTLYYTSASAIGAYYTVDFFDKEKNYLSDSRGDLPSAGAGVFTTPANCYYIIVNTNKSQCSIDALCVNYPSTDTSYHAYNGNTYTFDWTSEGTVYGGYLDVTNGKLVSTANRVDLGSLTYSKYEDALLVSGAMFYIDGVLPDCKQFQIDETPNAICPGYTVVARSRFDATDKSVCIVGSGASNFLCIQDSNLSSLTPAEFKTAMSGVYLVYEVATPDVYTLTPTAIQALSGVNNITSDLGGNLEVRYTSGEIAGQIIDICKMVIAEMGE